MKKLAAWATDDASVPALSINLKPPSEREVLGDQTAAETWARAWANVSRGQGLKVNWEQRSWQRIGRQTVPVRLCLTSPHAVATFVGGQPAASWQRLRDRVERLRAELGRHEMLDRSIRRHAAEITGWDDARFHRVVEATKWLTDHPATGLRPRQVPVRGVDSKWLSAHRSVVTALHGAATGHADLGLMDPDRLLRLRFLDHTLAPGGLVDVAAPAHQVASLALAPRVVFVFENLECVLAMPAWAGAVAVHGSGYAVDVAADLPWVARVPVIYWGDLDSHGFAIAHRLRTHHRDVTSVMMDEATLVQHRDLWVPEPKPQRGELPSLTSSEQTALQRVRSEGDVRLEQERIPWDVALGHLREAARLVEAR